MTLQLWSPFGPTFEEKLSVGLAKFSACAAGASESRESAMLSPANRVPTRMPRMVRMRSAQDAGSEPLLLRSRAVGQVHHAVVVCPAGCERHLARRGVRGEQPRPSAAGNREHEQVQPVHQAV